MTTGLSLCFFLVANAALGGESRSGYWGELQGVRNCTNPFTESEIMRCQNWSGTSATDARLFVRSGVTPMASTHAEVEIDYDNSMWSKANYSKCLDGDSYPTSAGTNDGVVPVNVDISDAHLR